MEVIPNGNGIKILIIPNEYVINMIIVSHHGIKPSIITSIISMYLFFWFPQNNDNDWDQFEDTEMMIWIWIG